MLIKITVFIVCSFSVLCCRHHEQPINNNSINSRFAGTWKLISRIDKDSNNIVRTESTLGSDPIAMVIYDTLGNVSVQIMKRHRNDGIIQNQAETPNSLAVLNGYDAYFGTYKIDTAKREITHIVEGAIDPSGVGKRLVRSYAFSNDTLRFSFSTMNSGVVVKRTLTFVRQTSTR